MKKLFTVKKNTNYPIHEMWYEKRLVFKTLMCLIYLIIITLLSVCIYQLYQEKLEIIPWSEAKSVNDYSYINVSYMSEKFAVYEDEGKEIHFVIEEEDTGQWHTYLIAINTSDYDKFKSIIDYTYERTKEVPKPIKVYGYPVLINDELKDLAITNLPNFVPAENEVVINKDNFNQYLTNSYLDTTMAQKDELSLSLCLVIIILVIIIVMFILTIFDQDKRVYHKVEEVYYGKKKKTFSVHK